MLKLVYLSLKKLSAGCLFLGLLGVIFYDSMYHFDVDLIHLKRQHQSSQKNWNLFYDQRYVFNDSAFRYEADFQNIANLIQSQSVILSDISSSYYAATYLPAYMKNIHRHHGRRKTDGVSTLLDSRKMCYLQDPENVEDVKNFIKGHNELMNKRGLPELLYIIVNRDDKNLNLRQDCLWTARERLIKHLDSLADSIFQGNYLNLYKIKTTNN